MSDYIKEKIKEFREKFIFEGEYPGDGNKYWCVINDAEAITSFLQSALQEMEERTLQQEHERLATSVVTTCHNCGKVVHVFPDDVTKLIVLSQKKKDCPKKKLLGKEFIKLAKKVNKDIQKEEKIKYSQDDICAEHGRKGCSH